MYEYFPCGEASKGVHGYQDRIADLEEDGSMEMFTEDTLKLLSLQKSCLLLLKPCVTEETSSNVTLACERKHDYSNVFLLAKLYICVLMQIAFWDWDVQQEEKSVRMLSLIK